MQEDARKPPGMAWYWLRATYSTGKLTACFTVPKGAAWLWLVMPVPLPCTQVDCLKPRSVTVSTRLLKARPVIVFQ